LPDGQYLGTDVPLAYQPGELNMIAMRYHKSRER